MNLTQYLFPDCILTGCTADSRDALLSLQIAAIHRHLTGKGLPCPLPEDMLKAVTERETQQSTCLGEGIAVPHARMEGLSTIGLSVAVLPRPVPFESGAQRDVGISILVIAPVERPNLVLKIWGAFIRLLRTPGVRGQLAAARTPQEACTLLRGHNLALEISLTARDLMIRPPFQVRPETPLRQVCFLMNKHHEVATAVVDEGGRLLGEITSDRIFQYGMPEFFTQLQSVSFVRHFNPLEKYFEEESSLTAGALMTPGFATVRPEATLIEVIFLITVKNHTKVYVTDAGGKLLGVIGRLTVLDRAINF
jgi:PTS system nitrogen regulatory IIA component